MYYNIIFIILGNNFLNSDLEVLFSVMLNKVQQVHKRIKWAGRANLTVCFQLWQLWIRGTTKYRQYFIPSLLGEIGFNCPW